MLMILYCLTDIHEQIIFKFSVDVDFAFVCYELMNYLCATGHWKWDFASDYFFKKLWKQAAKNEKKQ